MKTVDRKQRNTGNKVQMVDMLGTTSEILHKFNPLDSIRDPKNYDIMLIWCSMFFTNPHNCYNDYNVIAHARSSGF